ncbi:class I SAM-dependent methyltransferase [Amycolatopsis jiangsuensis]|uniref:Ubiquinone/menaquinone biosynthesis C-methylase UbiE n=1 Tax=Amycolatopsis jiangsuensis TaxID=1181879 RepID=A0A840IXS3_9PSEU|nr:class I SAM-dependent methyltransferase [Amycolatopsis jiangsuensis]MBB4686309.1 ubiquinone/menaquinone biosynthesis C-methylase UbiE [Amycolatopsis jiangsuensis]
MSALFDTQAPGYDGDLFHPLVAGTLVDGLVRRPSLLVDVATGTGAAAFAALRLAPESVLAVDFAPAMIARAREKAAALDPEGRISWQVAPAVPLPVGDGEADAVVCASALHFLGAAALADWRRVLRPGGRLAFSISLAQRLRRDGPMGELMPRDLCIPATAEEAAALATDAGFTAATARTVTSDEGNRVRQVFAVFAEG